MKIGGGKKRKGWEPEEKQRERALRMTFPLARRPAPFILLTLSALIAARVSSESNGLARIPQRGWNSWNYEQAFCPGASPGLCLNETFMVQITDAVVDSGLAAAGYDIINLSEAWPAPARAPNGSLVGDPERFPRGIAWLAAYIHQRGLRFGIYLDVGVKTCAGFPGSLGSEDLDVSTIVSWGADYVWLDGCNYSGNFTSYLALYRSWGQRFAAAPRAIVWEASLPAYDLSKTDLEDVGSFSHEMRFFDDNRPEFSQILRILDFTVSSGVLAHSRPGQWVFMDMLEVGNGMSDAEDRAHFSLWVILAQPLHMGNDLTSLRAATLEILGNAEVLAVAADPLGRPGQRVGPGVTPPSCPSPPNASAWSHTAGGYRETCAGEAGNLGPEFKNLTLAQAQAGCCGLARCAGFSFDPLTGSGFFKADMGCQWMPGQFDGYARPSGAAAVDEAYARPLSNGDWALVLLNRGGAAQQMCVAFGGAPMGLNPYAATRVRDLWARTTQVAQGSYCTTVGSHDAAMLRLSQ